MESNLFQRRALGILCALLAPCCLLFGLFGKDVNLPGWYESISATYYANDKIFMIGLLFATAVFFFTYAGYDWRDRLVSIIQGAAALGVITFPCYSAGLPPTTGLFNLPVSASNIIHCISATTLFLAFGVNIMFLFTLSSGEITDAKAKRNMIYRICGGTIFLFMIIQACTSTFLKGKFGSFPTTWFNEFIMLEAFSVAWLVKGEAIGTLND